MWKLLAAAINRFVVRSYEEASTDPAAKGPSGGSSRPVAARGPEPLTREAVEQHFQRAVQLLQSGNNAAAEEAIQLAVKRAAAEGKGAGPIYAEALFKEGTILRAVGSLERAAAAWRAAVDVSAVDDAAREDRFTYQASLADLLAHAGKLDEAEQVLRTCVSEQKGFYGPQHPTYALGLSALADLLLVRSQPATALEAIDEAVSIDTAASHERLPIDLATRAYAVKAARGNDANSLEPWASLSPQTQAILVKQCLARAEHFDSRIVRAVLLELRERLESTSDIPVVLPVSVNIALANLGRLSGDHDARIQALRQTIELCEPLPDRTHLATAYQELATALDEANQQAEVPAAYDAAAQAAREADKPALLSAILRNYALWSDRAGHSERADELHREAVHHGASCGDWAVHGRSTTAYGIFLQHAGRPENAREMLEEALAHLPPSHPDAAAAQEHLTALDRGEPCACHNKNQKT
jgi:tetratricopeptide (TPR) repeat protein